VNVNTVYAPRAIRRGRAIALHCSGGGASQWRHLAEVLGGRYEVLAPEHYGSESSEPWTGEHAFTLADEAVRAITLIDQSEEKVHLVGHSYGGILEWPRRLGGNASGSAECAYPLGTESTTRFSRTDR
jgi:surfactin synthase thioesterase subunit